MQESVTGVLLPDEKGFLNNILNRNRVQGKWLEATEAFVTYFTTHIDPNIHSLYLRGSVASGTATEHLSDIDFYVVTHKPISSSEIIKIKEYADQLNKKYPFISRFDIGHYTKDQMLSQKEGFLLKITSFCIYGDDISEYIASPRPGSDMTLSISQLEEDIRTIKRDTASGVYADTEKVRSLCVWISKKIIRSGFELVAEREGSFTRNIGSCHFIFSKYYPHQSKAMQEVIELLKYKTDTIADILPVLDGIGSWLVNEYKITQREPG